MLKQSDVFYRERIDLDSDLPGGRPVIKGTGLSVEFVLVQLAETLDLQELLAANPRLSVEDVRAALTYASDVVGRYREPALVSTASSQTAGEALLAFAALGKELGLKGPPDLSARIDDYLYGDDV